MTIEKVRTLIFKISKCSLQFEETRVVLKIGLERLLVAEILWNYNELITHLIKVTYNLMYSCTNTMILGVGFVLFSF